MTDELFDMLLEKAIKSFGEQYVNVDDALLAPHRFSRSFERRANRLIKRQSAVPITVNKRHSLKRTLTIAAVIVILMAVLALSVEASRNAIFNFFMDVFRPFTHVTVKEDTNAPEQIVDIYGITELPEGYELVQRNDLVDTIKTVYSNDVNNLTLRQSVKKDYHANIDTQNSTPEAIAVNGYNGFIVDYGELCYLEWETEHYIFSLMGSFGKEEIIEIAGSCDVLFPNNGDPGIIVTTSTAPSDEYALWDFEKDSYPSLDEVPLGKKGTTSAYLMEFSERYLPHNDDLVTFSFEPVSKNIDVKGLPESISKQEFITLYCTAAELIDRFTANDFTPAGIIDPDNRYYIDLTDEMTGSEKRYYGTGYRFSTFYYTLVDYMTHKLISRLYNDCGFYFETDNEMWAADEHGQSIVPKNYLDVEIMDASDTEFTLKTSGDNSIVCKFVKRDDGWRIDEWSQEQ